MYITNIDCQPSGPFNTKLVVSYRPVPSDLTAKASDLTKTAKIAHGQPVCIGDPSTIGIKDISKPDFGDAVEAHPGDVPIFWACGVTSTMAALSASTPAKSTQL